MSHAPSSADQHFSSGTVGGTHDAESQSQPLLLAKHKRHQSRRARLDSIVGDAMAMAAAAGAAAGAQSAAVSAALEEVVEEDEEEEEEEEEDEEHRRGRKTTRRRRGWRRGGGAEEGDAAAAAAAVAAPSDPRRSGRMPSVGQTPEKDEKEKGKGKEKEREKEREKNSGSKKKKKKRERPAAAAGRGGVSILYWRYEKGSTMRKLSAKRALRSGQDFVTLLVGFSSVSFFCPLFFSSSFFSSSFFFLSVFLFFLSLLFFFLSFFLSCHFSPLRSLTSPPSSLSFIPGLGVYYATFDGQGGAYPWSITMQYSTLMPLLVSVSPASGSQPSVP